MPEWNVEDIEGDVRVTHWHDDGTRHTAAIATDNARLRQAECDDCHETFTIDRDTERRLIADDSADARAYDETETTAPAPARDE